MVQVDTEMMRGREHAPYIGTLEEHDHSHGRRKRG
jgi:hypothetical protein